MASSNGNISRVTGPLSPVNSPHKGQWRGALIFSLICALNKRLGEQSWGWRYETPLRSVWRHCTEADRAYLVPLQPCAQHSNTFWLIMQHILRDLIVSHHVAAVKLEKIKNFMLDDFRDNSSGCCSWANFVDGGWFHWIWILTWAF